VVISSGSFAAQVVYGVLPWILAAWLLKKYDVETLRHRFPPTRAPRQARAA
jgi:hypothetical protein